MGDQGAFRSAAAASSASGASIAKSIVPQAVRSEIGDSRWDTIPRWKIALAIGTPLALGAAASIWYYKSRKSQSKKPAAAKTEEDGVTSKNDGKGKATTEKPQDPLQQAQNMKNTGNKYFKGGKFDKAIECYTNAIALCPSGSKEDISTFYQNRAAAYEQLKNYDKVIEDCNAALDLNSRYVKALARRAKAYEVKKELALSLEDVTAVCILENFGNQQSLFMADRVLKELGRSRAKEKYKEREPQNPSNQFVSNYLSAFANDPILENCQTSHRDQSESDDSEKERVEEMEKDVVKTSGYKRAVEMLRRHEYSEILKRCTSEIETAGSTDVAGALLLRATFYALRGEMEQAVDDFQKLLDINDISDRVRANALIKRACVRMQLGDSENALKDFDEAVKCDPTNSDVYHHRGQIQLLMGQLQDACKDFEKSVELCPKEFAVSHVQKCYADIRLAMSAAGAVTKPLDELIKKFEKTVDKFPKCAEGYALLGQVLVEMKQYSKADENFERAQKLEPNNGNIYVHRGLLRLQWQQDVDAAARLINEAINVEDKCVFAYETLGTIEIQRGCLDKAIELFNKAINLVKTEDEMTHLYSMLDAAMAQANVAKRLGIPLPSMM